MSVGDGCPAAKISYDPAAGEVRVSGRFQGTERRVGDCITSRASDLRSGDSVLVFSAETTEHYRLRYGSVTIRAVCHPDFSIQPEEVNPASIKSPTLQRILSPCRLRENWLAWYFSYVAYRLVSS